MSMRTPCWRRRSRASRRLDNSASSPRRKPFSRRSRESDAMNSARAHEPASREEAAAERFSAYYSLWGGHLSRGEPAAMRQIAELFLREAAARPDCPERL